MKIRILSFNIHKGLNWSNKKYTLDLLKEALVKVNADIIFLQEVVGEHKRRSQEFKGWKAEPQYQFLAHLKWPYFAYAKNAVHTHGHHGNVILSRFPILSWEQQDISTNRFEQRGILYCNIAITPQKILHAYCLHLDLLHQGRKKQYVKIVKRLQKDVIADEPVIIAGDFNDWNHQSCTFLEKNFGLKEAFKATHGMYAATFPVQKPFLHLDRIYTKSVQVLSVDVLRNGLWKIISDHAAIYAELII